MENGSNVSGLSHDEINNMGSDWSNSEDNVIQGIHPFFKLHNHLFKIYKDIYYKFYCKIIYFNIFKLTLYVFI